MISFYKWKRLGVFTLLGTLPVLIFIMIFLSSVEFIIVDPIYLVIALMASLLVAVILIIMGGRMLRHPFISMLEGKGLLSMILDSTGLVGLFNVVVDAPRMKGIFPVKGVEEVEDTYNTDLMHRLFVPRDAKLTKAVSFKHDDNGNVVVDRYVDVLVLPTGDEKYDHLFSLENRPTFIYNKVIGKFMSRDGLAKFEKDLMLKHNALNILRKVQEIDVNFRNFARYTGELLKPEKKGIFANPIIKYILIGLVVLMIIVIMMLFLPAFLESGSKIMPPRTTIPFIRGGLL